MLLTDGENTVEPEPARGGQAARDRGVRIDTVGFGTTAGCHARGRGLPGPQPPRRGDARRASRHDRRHVLRGRRPGRPERASTTTSGGGWTVRTEPFELTSLFAGLGFVLLVVGGAALAALVRADAMTRGAMTLLWPAVLVLLAVLPLLVVVRVWALRRRRTGVRFSSLSLVRAAVPRSSRSAATCRSRCSCVGLGSLVFAMARPAAIIPVPTGQSTVVLAMDVSRSMCATDIPPNRLIAAEEAAASFVESQDDDTADRHRRVRRLRRDRPATDRRRRGPARRHRIARDRTPDRDRQRHPRVDRRHRRDRPVDRAERRRGATRRPARHRRSRRATTPRPSSCC